VSTRLHTCVVVVVLTELWGNVGQEGRTAALALAVTEIYTNTVLTNLRCCELGCNQRLTLLIPPSRSTQPPFQNRTREKQNNTDGELRPHVWERIVNPQTHFNQEH